MWVKTQDNEEIRRVDNMYYGPYIDGTDRIAGYTVRTQVHDIIIKLGEYETEEKAQEVIERFWNCLVNGGKAFQMPKEV